jgi:hypothetical protein
MIARIETGRTTSPPARVLEDCEKILNLAPGTLQRLAEGSLTHRVQERRDPSQAPDYARVWPSFPYEMVNSLFASATDEIRILQTWVNDIIPFVPGIQSALSNGAQLAISVLDPNSQFSALRLESLGISNQRYPAIQLMKLLADLEHFHGSDRRSGTLQVRAHSHPQTVHIYGTERTLVLGFYWNGKFSLLGPQIEVDTHNSVIGRAAWEEFDHLWERGRVISPSDYE